MYVYMKHGIWKHMNFLLADTAMISISYILAYYLRNENVGFPAVYQQLIIVLYLIHFCLAFLVEPYQGILHRGYLKEFVRVINLNVVLAMAIFGYLFFTKQSALFSRIVFIYFIILNISLVYLERISLKRYINRKRKESDEVSNLLVITMKKDAPELAEKLQKMNLPTMELVGIVLMDGSGEEPGIGNCPVVMSKASMWEYVRTHVVDEILISLPTYAREDICEEIQEFAQMGLTIHLNMDALPYYIPNQRIQKIGDMTLLTGAMKMASPEQIMLKRLMDIAGGILGLLITILFGIILVPAIKLDSPGPAIFSQIRIGKNGRRFRIYKFRSMYIDAEEHKKDLLEQNKMNGLMFKMDEDPRVTRVGRFLRRTSLDELPQFWNVLKGDMSLVGTRPPTEDEYQQYELVHKRRLSIKPGLTGMWQVSGRSEITDFEEVLELDTQYIMEWSIAMDFRILFKTVKTVLGMKGAV